MKPVPPQIGSSSNSKTSFVETLKVKSLIYDGINESIENITEEGSMDPSSKTSAINIERSVPGYYFSNFLNPDNSFSGNSMCTDSKNNVYISGSIFERLPERNGIFSRYIPDGPSGNLLVKYDSYGNVISFVVMHDYVSVKCDSFDNLYVLTRVYNAGFAVNNFSAYSNTNTLAFTIPSQTFSNAIIIKYNSEGCAVSWCHVYNDAFFALILTNVDTDSYGNMYGMFHQTAAITNFTISNFSYDENNPFVKFNVTVPSSQGYIIVKWDSSGEAVSWTWLESQIDYRWLKYSSYDDSLWLFGRKYSNSTVTINNFSTDSSLNASSFSLVGTGAFMIKWNNEGNVTAWNMPFDSQDYILTSADINSVGDVYISGYLDDEETTGIKNISFSPTEGSQGGTIPYGYYCPFIVKWKSTGLFDSYTIINDPNLDSYTDQPVYMTIDSKDNVYLTGNYYALTYPLVLCDFNSSAQVQTLPQDENDSYSYFAVKWDVDGNLVSHSSSTQAASGDNVDLYSKSIMVDNDDNLYVLGKISSDYANISDFTSTENSTTRVEYLRNGDFNDNNGGFLVKYDARGIIDLGTFTANKSYFILSDPVSTSDSFIKKVIFNTVNYTYIVKTSKQQFSIPVAGGPVIKYFLWDGTMWSMLN